MARREVACSSADLDKLHSQMLRGFDRRDEFVLSCRDFHGPPRGYKITTTIKALSLLGIDEEDVIHFEGWPYFVVKLTCNKHVVGWPTADLVLEHMSIDFSKALKKGDSRSEVEWLYSEYPSRAQKAVKRFQEAVGVSA